MENPALKYKWIDALRGYAILMVLLVHTQVYHNLGSMLPILKKFISAGGNGVQLFFMVSAFTLSLSNDKRKNEGSGKIEFLTRRVFRIAPLFFIAIIYYLFQEGLGPRYWLGDQGSITPLNIMSHFLFVNGFYPYWINSIVPGGWSIAVEMQFYVLVPFIFMYIKQTRDFMILYAFSLALFIFNSYSFVNHSLISDEVLWGNFLRFSLLNNLHIFVLGFLAYDFYKKKQSFNDNKDLVWWSYFILFLSGSSYLYFLATSASLFFVAISISLFFVGFILNPSVCMVNKLVCYIGRVSFSLYLIHLAVFFWMNKLGLIELIDLDIHISSDIGFLIKFVLLLSLSLLVSSMTYFFIETKGIALGQKIIIAYKKHRA